MCPVSWARCSVRSRGSGWTGRLYGVVRGWGWGSSAQATRWGEGVERVTTDVGTRDRLLTDGRTDGWTDGHFVRVWCGRLTTAFFFSDGFLLYRSRSLLRNERCGVSKRGAPPAAALLGDGDAQVLDVQAKCLSVWFLSACLHVCLSLAIFLSACLSMDGSNLALQIALSGTSSSEPL